MESTQLIKLLCELVAMVRHRLNQSMESAIALVMMSATAQALKDGQVAQPTAEKAFGMLIDEINCSSIRVSSGASKRNVATA